MNHADIDNLPNVSYTHTRNMSAVLICICIYILLVIERPWESIRYLHGLPIEKTFAIFMIVVALIMKKFKIVSSPTNKWVYTLLAIHFIFSPFAYSASAAVEQGIVYAKMVVLYLLMLSVADDEWSLKILIKAYFISTFLYVLHSLWEFKNGRHLYRMGISRMVGVDTTYNDPNSFGATIVLSLPIVYALLRTEVSKNVRLLCFVYFIFAVICIVLTGSRSSFAALMVLVVIWIFVQQGKRKIQIMIASMLTIILIWNVMPEEKQGRFRTLWDDSAGPANAKTSADMRLLSWKASLRMFQQKPLTGVGAGGDNFINYRMSHSVDDGPPIFSQAHNLYGEVLAEHGAIGTLLFSGLIISIWRCCRWARAQLLLVGAMRSFAFNLSGAIIVTLILLLVLGFAGHNFYRPLWLWLAAWSGSLMAIAKVAATKET